MERGQHVNRPANTNDLSEILNRPNRDSEFLFNQFPRWKHNQYRDYLTTDSYLRCQKQDSFPIIQFATSPASAVLACR